MGLGDGLGWTNSTRAKATCTADGTLLQPDKALTPLDWSLWVDLAQQIEFDDCIRSPWPCKPQLLQSHTRIPSTVSGRVLHWHHIVAVAVNAYPLSTTDLWPALPNTTGWSWVSLRRSVLRHGCIDGEDAFGHGGCASSTVCQADSGDEGLCLPVIDTQVGFWDESNLHIAWAQYLLAPRSEVGWSLLGELDKYNPVSRVRLQSVDFGSDGITIQVAGSKGESVSLYAITPQNKIMRKSVDVGDDGSAQVTFGADS
eukprot:COSAG02_NODE_1544_length_11996_cov_143.122468_1_plen_256_part_00